MGIETAIIASLIGAAGSLGGSAIASRGARGAADTQAAAGREALDLQREIFATQRADLAPWRAGGEVALDELLRMSGLGESPAGSGAPTSSSNTRLLDGSLGSDGVYQFKPTDPSYNFRFDEGHRAVQRGAGARGDVLGGRAAKELLLYGQGAASQEFGAQFNRLASIAGIGQTATSQGVQAAGRSGDVQSDLLTSIGAASGAGQAASGQIWGQGLATTAGNIGQMILLADLLKSANPTP